ncbi:hypothetical protein PAMC26510_31990 [Caballeronia sordidicola]|uniref:Uncharacterized protein n=1 Tax=Caballeronia sordidicola TaxID=196367 RepID=A0A242MB69_CABSO|nr:hypothetical protein PAMC26510_31990 [Caballeronia sordidicola]OTP67983.1 hypothetical protein PAMC26577_35145 [Caballeronia sordidicola]
MSISDEAGGIIVASGEALLTAALTTALPLDALLTVAPVALLLSLEPPQAVKM